MSNHLPNKTELLSQVSYLSISDLAPYKYNAKLHPKKQTQQIANSIHQHGFINPIIVNEKNVIIAGHGRFEAAKLLKLKTVPIIRVAHLSDEEARAYRLADNQLTLNSGYPYYLCRNKDCAENKKSIKRDLMEEQFEELLYEATPTPDMVCMLRTGVKEIWQQHYEDFENRHHALERNLRDLDIRIEQFMDRIIEAESPTVIRAYETKIAKLENEKIILREKLAFAEEAPTDFETSFQTVFDFIENPQKLWHSEDIEHKRIVLKLTFARPLQYRRNEGFQTAALALPFAVLRDFSNGKSGMVVPSGLTSNRLIHFVTALQELSKAFEAPPKLDGKSFLWKPLMAA